MFSYWFYTSQAVNRSPDTLREILEESWRRNSKLGMTGVLVYRDGRYMQYLEGATAELRRLVARIERDTRHRGIQTLSMDQSEERLFLGWQMGFLDGDAASESDAYRAFLTALLDRLQDTDHKKSIARQLKAFALGSA